MALISILLAVVVATALGALWYSPLMFGHAWAELSGLGGFDPSKQKGVWKSYTGNILLNFVTVLVIQAALEAGFSITDVFALWSAFTLPVYANEVFWNKKPTKLFLIDAGFSLVLVAFVSQTIIWLI